MVDTGHLVFGNEKKRNITELVNAITTIPRRFKATPNNDNIHFYFPLPQLVGKRKTKGNRERNKLRQVVTYSSITIWIAHAAPPSSLSFIQRHSFPRRLFQVPFKCFPFLSIFTCFFRHKGLSSFAFRKRENFKTLVPPCSPLCHPFALLRSIQSPANKGNHPGERVCDWVKGVEVSVRQIISPNQRTNERWPKITMLL